MSEARPAGGSDRLMRVLAEFVAAEGALDIPTLVERTGLPRSTLYRLIGVLRQWGLVLEYRGRYLPGPLGLSLAREFESSADFVDELMPSMKRLAARSQEGVGLMMAAHQRVVCVALAESPRALRCTFRHGTGAPLTAGASAQALLAFMPEETWRDSVPDVPERATRLAHLESLRADIRKRGYAVSANEVDPGVWGVSAPVHARPDQVIAALTLMAPVERAQSREEELIELTTAAARRAGELLQYQ